MKSKAQHPKNWSNIAKVDIQKKVKTKKKHQ